MSKDSILEPGEPCDGTCGGTDLGDCSHTRRQRGSETPAEWAGKMSDAELLERMEEYAGDAALPRAVAAEVKRRFNVARRVL